MVGWCMNENITVKRSNEINERGVFAVEKITEGEIIEISPIIEVKDGEMKDYVFGYKCYSYIPTGYGMLYNHSERENAKYEVIDVNEYEWDEETNTHIKGKGFKVSAKREIEAGEEICISYGTMGWLNHRKIKYKELCKK